MRRPLFPVTHLWGRSWRRLCTSSRVQGILSKNTLGCVCVCKCNAVTMYYTFMYIKSMPSIKKGQYLWLNLLLKRQFDPPVKTKLAPILTQTEDENVVLLHIPIVFEHTTSYNINLWSWIMNIYQYTAAVSQQQKRRGGFSSTHIPLGSSLQATITSCAAEKCSWESKGPSSRIRRRKTLLLSGDPLSWCSYPVWTHLCLDSYGLISV